MSVKNEQNNNTAVLIAEVTTRNEETGTINIDLSKLPRNSEQTRSVQNLLSSQGLYVSSTHRYYNDGIAGDITEFGLEMHAGGATVASQYLNMDAMTDTYLTADDIMRIQIALNAATDNPSKKITVDGAMGPQTANRFAQYLEEQKASMNETEYEQTLGRQNTGIFDAMRKHVSDSRLQSLGIRESNLGSFREAQHSTDDDHDHSALPRARVPTSAQALNTDGLILSDPVANANSSERGEMGRDGRHQGADYALSAQGGDSNIYAAADGVVAFAGPAGAYGNLIILYHGEHDGTRVFTYHAHVPGSSLSRVSEGQFIERGEAFAEIGNTGRSSGPHLHFEVVLERNDRGFVVNPKEVLDGQTDLSSRFEQDRLMNSAAPLVSRDTSRVHGQVLANNSEIDEYDTILASRDTGPTALS